MFKKGHSGNPQGRPRSALNKVARPLKMQISDFLNERFTELPGIWQKLTPQQRIKMFTELLPFVLPKVSSIDLDINLAQLSDYDLDRIIDKLLNNEQKKLDRTAGI